MSNEYNEMTWGHHSLTPHKMGSKRACPKARTWWWPAAKVQLMNFYCTAVWAITIRTNFAFPCKIVSYSLHMRKILANCCFLLTPLGRVNAFNACRSFHSLQDLVRVGEPVTCQTFRARNILKLTNGNLQYTQLLPHPEIAVWRNKIIISPTHEHRIGKHPQFLKKCLMRLQRVKCGITKESLS